MQKKIRSLVIFTLLLLAVSAFAQSAHTIRADVPFSFETAGKMWPAGEYRVKFDVQLSTVTIAPFGRGPVTVFTTTTDDPNSTLQSYLRFQRYGDTWVLKDVSFDGAVRSINLGKPERELLRADLTKSHEIREIVSGSEALAQSNFDKAKN